MRGFLFVVATLVCFNAPKTGHGYPLNEGTGDPDNPYEACYDFLTEYMPSRDENVISSILLNQTITYALTARYRFSYAKEVPWDMFLNNVLPYYVLGDYKTPEQD